MFLSLKYKLINNKFYFFHTLILVCVSGLKLTTTSLALAPRHYPYYAVILKFVYGVLLILNVLGVGLLWGLVLIRRKEIEMRAKEDLVEDTRSFIIVDQRNWRNSFSCLCRFSFLLNDNDEDLAKDGNTTDEDEEPCIIVSQPEIAI